MGNSLGSKKAAKIMKINGETFKLKTPVKAGAVVKDYPGHVLLESEAVKHFGVRAKPLEAHENLEPRRLYFVLELPRTTKQGVPRRARSGIQMSAKERLENLMLSRRSVSDLSIMRPASASKNEEREKESKTMRIKLKLPKAQVEKLIKESKSQVEVAKKIMDLCLLKNGSMSKQQLHWKGGNIGAEKGLKARDFCFMGNKEGGSRIMVAS